MHRLIDIEWPDFGEGAYPPRSSVDEYEARVEATRAAMEQGGLTHLVVFADREHFFNLTWLTRLDPRFEEAMLVLRASVEPLIVVGNECEGYLPHSPLYAEGKLRKERFQPFSLLDQPRDESRTLKEIFSGEGIDAGSKVGCVGYKYYRDRTAIDVPAFVVDALRDLAGREEVVNATGMFMNPDTGLRTFCSPSEIAYLEYTNVQASEGLRSMLFGLREGMTDHDLGRLARFNGEPLGCHPTLSIGGTPGLCGPSGQVVRRGVSMSTNISYWGSNICRAGWIAESEEDLKPEARDYVRVFAGPYFEAMAEWLGAMKIGTPGAFFSDLIRERLPFDRFGIFLNAGHLIHLEEWVSSPIYPGSTIPIHSGMAIQVDVIPSHEAYFSTRMEDGIVIADKALRDEVRAGFPDCYNRTQARRAFMRDTLGIELPEEVLPLSNIPAIVPPFFLKPNRILALEA